MPALALVQIMSVDEPINRMYSYFKEHPSFEVDLKASTSTGVSGTGHIAEERPNKISFTLAYPDNTYTMKCDGYSVLEDSTKWKLYDDYLGDKQLWMPDAPFVTADWRMAVPAPLFVMDLTKFFTKVTKRELEQQTTIGAAKADVVHIQVTKAERFIDYRMYIDQVGRLIRFSTSFEEGPTVQFEISGYAPKQLPASTFKLRTNPGFNAYELPWSARPMHFDEKVPADEVVDVSGAKSDLASIVGTPGLLAVVDPAWLKTPNGKDAVQRLQGNLAKWGGGKLTLFNEDQGKPEGSPFPIAYDPTGKLLDKLNAPGSPVFYCINKDGRLERVFMGYDPLDAHFWTELKQAITQPGKSREY